MSSHSGPTVGICTTWSITEMASKPASSAALADAPQVVGELRATAGPGEPAEVEGEAEGHGVLPLGLGRPWAR